MSRIRSRCESEWSHHFYFNFLNAKRITKTIKGLNNTEALGMDGIPTSVLKKGVEVMARPISHLVNRSMVEGRVPAAFRIRRVHLIHKGKEKPGEDPASYCPVSILPALSKVLESHVKDNLEDHLRKVNGLPGSQYGFRQRGPAPLCWLTRRPAVCRKQQKANSFA
jgi:hypothetical protein